MAKGQSTLLTIREASVLLGCHPNTLRNWDREGVLTALRIGSRSDRKYKRRDILKFIGANRDRRSLYINKNNGIENSPDNPAGWPLGNLQQDEAMSLIVKGVIENGQVTMAVFDRRLNLALFNTAYAEYFSRIYGKKPSPGQNIAQLLHHLSHDRIRIVNTWKKALAGNTFYVVDEYGDPKIGIRTYEKYFSPIRNSTGEVVYATVTIKDVTDRVEAEQKLRHEKARLEAIFHAVVDGIAVFDKMGNLFMLNEAQAKIFGFKSIEDTKQNLAFFSRYFKLYTPNRKEVPLGEWPVSRVLRGESFTQYELWVKRTDTNNEWFVSYSGSPVYDDKDNLAMGVIISKDITDKRLVEEILLMSGKMFRELAESMPQLVWTAQADGTVDYYNEKYKDYGIEMQDNKYLWAPILHDDDKRKTIDAWSNAIKTGNPYEIEHRVKMKNGQFAWHLSRAVPVKDHNGKIIKWYGTATDINKLKNLEQQKDEFLGIASHELKTPITSIKAYGQVLQQYFREREDLKSVDLLNKMDKQINKLTRIITDLLDVTRIQAGKLQFHIVRFDYNALILETVETIQRTTIKHKLVLELDESVNIQGDRERIGQVLINLLTNAIKYSPQADCIIIRTKLENGGVTSSVQDFGIGIKENRLNMIFKRYYRGDSDELDTIPGLGLGLYISKELVRRHNGILWVESKLNKGSTFSYYLPKKYSIIL